VERRVKSGDKKFREKFLNTSKNTQKPPSGFLGKSHPVFLPNLSRLLLPVKHQAHSQKNFERQNYIPLQSAQGKTLLFHAVV